MTEGNADLPPVQEEENRKITITEKYTAPQEDYTFPMLSDVILPKENHRELEDIILSIAHPMIFEMMGVKQDKAYLFEGPPGTGKTYSMTAIRNELVMSGIETVMLPYDIGRFGTAYINMGAVNLQKFFDAGKVQANKGTTMLYWFDEADMIMSKRGQSRWSTKEDDKVLDCLMKNLQEINNHNTNEYCFFATNFSEGMDEAATRAGRIDRVITFSLPNYDARKHAIKHYIQQANRKAKYQVVDLSTIDYDGLANKTDGFNYADITTVIQRSIRDKAYSFLYSCRDNPDKKIISPPKITNDDIDTALDIYKKGRAKLSHSISRESKKIGFA